MPSQEESDCKLPVFHFVISGIHHPDYGFILADNRRFHRIQDHQVFFAKLGYAPHLNQQGLEPEAFIWETFTRDQATKSRECLQTQLAAYLYDHSERFRMDYGMAYLSSLKECDSERLDQSFVCTQCPKRSSVGGAQCYHATRQRAVTSDESVLR
jgi:hypothetical protein